MVVTLQVHDILRVDLSFRVCIDDISYVQLSRIHILELIYQDKQAVACVNSLHETYASVTAINIHIRSLQFVILDHSGIAKAYQILTIMETSMGLSSVRTLSGTNLMTRIIKVIVFVCTRNTRSTGLVVTSHRNQILRFDVTQATIYPNRVDDECQFAISLFLVPDTGVINILIQ